jgi:Tfp pilus assembly protein FimT
MNGPLHIISSSRRRRLSAGRPIIPAGSTGHSLIELLVVLSLLGAAFGIGAGFLGHGLRTLEARGAAQTWQAAATWAQTGAVWQGSANELQFESGRVAVAADTGASRGDLGVAAPDVGAVANVNRWQREHGVTVRFVGGTAYPNSAGSVFFDSPGSDYRVTVRLESGLTVRSRVEPTP